MAQIDGDLEKLHRFIASGRFAEQAQLPPERDLAEALGFTRNRLRACLGKLERDGVIWRHVGKGTYIGARPEPDAEPAPVSTSPIDVMDARLVLEPELAQRAALRAAPEAIAEMRACIERIRGDDYDTFEFWDRRLHREIALAASSPLLLAMFDLIQSNRVIQVRTMQRRAYTVTGRIVIAHGEHGDVVDAIAERDPVGASDSMREHLRNVRRTLFGE